jgi:hypothetical protein
MRKATDRALTKRFVDGLAPEAKPYPQFDANLAGLGCVCTPPAARPISCSTGTSTAGRGGFS